MVRVDRLAPEDLDVADARRRTMATRQHRRSVIVPIKRPPDDGDAVRVPTLRGLPGTQIATRLFDDRDANDDGKLSGDEIPEQMKTRLDRIDSDGDGSVSRKEFAAMMRARGGQGRPDAGRRDS